MFHKVKPQCVSQSQDIIVSFEYLISYYNYKGVCKQKCSVFYPVSNPLIVSVDDKVTEQHCR